MIVVVIIGFLAIVAIPSYQRFMARAKRSEVYLNLGAIYMAEKAYHAEHGTYSSVLTGEGGIGWQPEGKPQYTYGFPGTAGKNYVQGALKAPLEELAPARAGTDDFTVVAVADIDGDGKPDVIAINDKREIKIIKDDL